MLTCEKVCVSVWVFVCQVILCLLISVSCVCLYVCMSVFIRVHLHECVCVYMCLCVCMSVCMCVCVCVCVCQCVCVCLCGCVFNICVLLFYFSADCLLCYDYMNKTLILHLLSRRSSSYPVDSLHFCLPLSVCFCILQSLSFRLSNIVYIFIKITSHNHFLTLTFLEIMFV